MSSMAKHTLIKDIVTEYASQFYGRIVSACPPSSDFPSDLEVSFTDFGELVASMEHRLQVIIAEDALATQTYHPVPLALTYAREGVQVTKSPWIKVRSKRHKEVSKDSLQDEVRRGEATIVLNGYGEVQRVVSLVAFEVTRGRGSTEIFAQLGKIEEGVIVAGCTLPGARMRRGELPLDAANRILSDRLWPLVNVRIRRLEREVEFQDGEDFPLRKQYLRTLVYVTLSEDVQAPTLRASVTDAMDVPLKEVYVFRGGKTALYAWISRSQLQHYKTPEGEQQLSAWLSLLKFDAPDASDNLNMDLEELLQG